MTRGIRNNNPGNMDCLLNNQMWDGQTGNDGRFATFVDMPHGIRAWFKNLHTQIVGHGYNTVTKLISTYAPPTENNTANYINAVASGLGVNPDDIITFDKDTAITILHACFRQENGLDADLVTDADIEKGWQLTGY